MKRKIRKVVLSICLSVLCGSICGKILYGIYDEAIKEDIIGERVYLIQTGAYSSYDKMVDNTSLSNYVYYKDDDGLFKSIIGVTKNYDNIEKISKLYSSDVIVTEYLSRDEKLNKKISDYDKKINDSSNQEEVKKNVIEMLSLYKDNKAVLLEITS